MQPLQLLSTLRAIANDTVSHCERQEFKPEFIYSMHNAKVATLEKALKGYNIGAKVSAKYNAEIRKIKLAPVKVKHYDSIKAEVKQGVSRLTSAIDFMKKR